MKSGVNRERALGISETLKQVTKHVSTFASIVGINTAAAGGNATLMTVG